MFAQTLVSYIRFRPKHNNQLLGPAPNTTISYVRLRPKHNNQLC